MQLADFKKNLDKIERNNFSYNLFSKVDSEVFDHVEQKLHIKIPNGIKAFYKFSNGMITKHPNFEILPIENWKYLEKGKIHFATFGECIKVYFDSSKINSASQWTIKTKGSDCEITQTMSSFWSSKIWHWIKKDRIIWEDKFWE